MNDPQPIETAPTDIVVLTDSGCAILTNMGYWDGKPGNRWVECSQGGFINECADNGPFFCSPKLWVPLPEWMK